MKFLPVSECAKWCRARSVDASDKRRLAFEGVAGAVVEMTLPRAGLEIVGLSNVLSTQLMGDEHAETLLWLTESGMWSESYEVVGAALWRRSLLGYGASPDANGLLFDKLEVDDQRAFLTLVMLFQWDANLVPAHAQYFVHISHDGYLRFTARDEGTAKVLQSAVDAWVHAGAAS